MFWWRRAWFYLHYVHANCQRGGWCAQVAAERVAWEMAKEHGFHLCVINPTFVLGPVISSRTDATSIDVFRVWHGCECHMGSARLCCCRRFLAISSACVFCDILKFTRCSSVLP